MKATYSKEKKRSRNGKAVRLSHEVLRMFPRSEKESYDKAFRLGLGIEGKLGDRAKLMWILKKPSLQLFDDKAKAKGASIQAMVGSDRKRPEVPKKVTVLMLGGK